MAHPIYSQLPLATHEIRLLTIFPAHRDDSITCKFHKTQLHPTTSNSFETISYTWGDASIYGEILLDGTPLQIPASAVAAIRNVRRPDRQRVVWIDSVCINQSDLNERSEQVKLMSTVYQQKQANLIHLADLGHEVAKRAFEGIERICREVERECEERGKKLEEIVFPDYGPWRYAKEGLGCRADMGALLEMYKLPWFRRLWVVQEAVLAHTNIIVCGDLSIDFEKVLTATCWLEHKTPFLDQEGLDEIVVQLLGFRGAMNMWLFRWDLAVYQHHPIPNPLSWLLGKAPFGASSDVKDQIYGMLGLYQAGAKTMDLPLGLMPDYTRDDAEVLRDATRAAIEERSSLKVLERHPQHRPNRPKGLPTWVPEWFREHQDGDPRALIRMFKACGESEEWSRTELLPTEPGMLRIKGMVISTIDKVATNTNELYDPEAVLSHLDEIEAIASPLTKIDTLPLGTTLLGGAGFNDIASATSAEAEIWPAYLRHYREKKDHPPWPNDLQSEAGEQGRAMAMFNNGFHNACRHRCFFSTVDGHVGIGPIESRVGDSVVVLQGGRFPFVVRRREAGGAFEMVGYCYTYGVMDGEAIRELERGTALATVFELI